MYRRFSHAGHAWEARGHGIGTGIGYQPMRWGVDFECLSDRQLPACSGEIGEMDPAAVTEEELRRALEYALITSALEHAERPLTVDDICERTGLASECVAARLQAMMNERVDEVLPPTDPPSYTIR